jgi:hypothetical protein
MTPATKTIKVTVSDHRQLKVMAAKNGEHVYQVVARLVKAAGRPATNGTKGKGAR